jgi:hypothetical protein
MKGNPEDSCDLRRKEKTTGSWTSILVNIGKVRAEVQSPLLHLDNNAYGSASVR